MAHERFEVIRSTGSQESVGAFVFDRDNSRVYMEGFDITDDGAGGGAADLSAIAEDVLPDAPSTRAVGSVAKPFAEGHFDAVYVDGALLGNPGIQYVDVQINDAQIKALPDNASHVILAAPSVDEVIHVLGGYALFDLVALYSNSGDAIQLAIGLQQSVGANFTPLAYLGEPGLLLNMGRFWVPITPSIISGHTVSFVSAVTAGKPLVIYDDDNMGGSHYTDGDPGNTISIRLFYVVVPATPFGGA